MGIPLFHTVPATAKSTYQLTDVYLRRIRNSMIRTTENSVSTSNRRLLLEICTNVWISDTSTTDAVGNGLNHSPIFPQGTTNMTVIQNKFLDPLKEERQNRGQSKVQSNIRSIQSDDSQMSPCFHTTGGVFHLCKKGIALLYKSCVRKKLSRYKNYILKEVLRTREKYKKIK